MSTTSKTGTKRINGEKWDISELAELLGLDENSVKQTPPEVLRKQVEMKKDLEQTKEKASKAEAKAKTPQRKTLAEKNKNKLRKFLQNKTEATESSLIMAEVVLAPWKGAKELKEEIAPDHSRTFSTPVHDAKLMLNILSELELLDEGYMEQLKLEADKE